MNIKLYVLICVDIKAMGGSQSSFKAHGAMRPWVGDKVKYIGKTYIGHEY